MVVIRCEIGVLYLFSVPFHRQMFNLWLVCVSELVHTSKKLVLEYHQIG
jgi:hypothetical protein